MLFSYNHLKSWLNFTLTPQELADLIYLHITEVESVTAVGAWANFVVGEIVDIKPHPNADKLQLTKVDVGTEVLDIVCGATNIAIGQKVPVALVGAILPDGTTIKPAVIRGQRSAGMLCSRAELGLTGDTSGIMLLDTSRPTGLPLGEVLGGAGDSALELKILANRPDYLSYRSLAREIAAVTRQDWVWPEPSAPTFTDSLHTKELLHVSIAEPAVCHRYLAKVVANVTIGPSPEWLQQVLLASNLRPVNNIVDAANYVMLELGNPIHTFDYDKLVGQEITVRLAKAKETLLGLDGKTHSLDNQTLVIADGKAPIAIAGVLGGEGSGVTQTTTRVVLEVANFDLVSIRNTSRRLGLRTDASARFERGLDIFLPELVMRRITALLKEVCPECELATDVIDIHDKLPSATREVTVRPTDIERLLGISLPAETMSDILGRLDLSTRLDDDRLIITIPHYRSDIDGLNDIAEEILRIYGTDKIPNVMPTMALVRPEIPLIVRVSRHTRELLARLGFQEIILSAFGASSTGAVELSNPLTTDATHLKTQLVTQLNSLEFNRPHIKIFELNTVFQSSKSGLPEESQQLALRIQGSEAYRIVRGTADALLREWGIRRVSWREVNGILGLRLVVGDQVVGELSGSDENANLTMNLTAIAPLVQPIKAYVELPKYPAIKMDMAFFVPDRVRLGELIDAIWATDPLVAKVELFDLFQPADQPRSAAFHIELRSPSRTLTKADRDQVAETIKNTLLERHKARLRDE